MESNTVDVPISTDGGIGMVKEFIGSVGVLIVLLVICWPVGLIYFFTKYEEIGPAYMPVYAMPHPGYGAPPPAYYPPPYQGPPPPPYR
jgi:hypothetical protein